MMNICAHVIDEITPSAPQTKTTLPSLPNSLSPIKRKAKSIKEDSNNQNNSTAEKEKAKTTNKGRGQS